MEGGIRNQTAQGEWSKRGRRVDNYDGFSNLNIPDTEIVWASRFQNPEPSVAMNRRVKRQIIIALTILAGIFGAFALIAQFA